MPALLLILIDSEVDDYGYGASFFLYITAWIFTGMTTMLGAVAIMTASPTPSANGGAMAMTDTFGAFEAPASVGGGGWQLGDRVVIEKKGPGTVAFVGDHHIEGTPRLVTVLR